MSAYNFKDLTDKQFGHWKVLYRDKDRENEYLNRTGKKGSAYWVC